MEILHSEKMMSRVHHHFRGDKGHPGNGDGHVTNIY
jgi:hypothetical protein